MIDADVLVTRTNAVIIFLHTIIGKTLERLYLAFGTVKVALYVPTQPPLSIYECN